MKTKIVKSSNHFICFNDFSEASQSKANSDRRPPDFAVVSAVADAFSTLNAANTQEHSREQSTVKDCPMMDPEAPYFHAPPLPIRNLPRPQSVLIDDHVYANIDESTTI